MYSNIGQKIKNLAGFLIVCGIIASVIGAIVLWVTTNLVWNGFIVLVCGIFISWAGTLTLYGFGELITKATDIERDLKLIQMLNVEQNAKCDDEHFVMTMQQIHREIISEYEEHDGDEEEHDGDENVPQADECPYCFAKIGIDDTECPNCGNKLK